MTVPSSFKAVFYSEAGAAGEISTRSLSPLEPNEVGIKITSTAINPVDWKIRDWRIFVPDGPVLLGSDAAGTITSLGSSVTDYKIGERVFFQGILGKDDYSTFQQYCKMPMELLGRTPKNVGDDEAAGVSLAMVCALTAFYDQSGHGMTPPWEKGGEEVGKGKSVVVLAGSSSVGQYAIQLAKLSGYTKILTSASRGNHEYLREIGAHVVLDRATATPEDFKEAIGESQLDFVFDPVGESETLKLGVKILQSAGRAGHVVMPFNGLNNGKADEDAVALGKSKDAVVEIKQIVGIGSKAELRHLSEPMFKHLGGEDGYLAKGRFLPNRVKVVEGGLDALEEALNLNKKGISGVKVVIRPNNP